MGEGLAHILVGGASTGRSENSPLAALLSQRFSVFNYDRRGRGDSGDMLPYTVARQVEDIEAWIHEAGGTPFVIGFSSCAVIAIHAAARGLRLEGQTHDVSPLVLASIVEGFFLG